MWIAPAREKKMDDVDAVCSRRLQLPSTNYLSVSDSADPGWIPEKKKAVV
jgi:hypothetical protein